jgi:hypothetical protein
LARIVILFCFNSASVMPCTPVLENVFAGLSSRLDLTILLEFDFVVVVVDEVVVVDVVVGSSATGSCAFCVVVVDDA